MPIKINELVIQIKVEESSQKIEERGNGEALVIRPQDKMLLAKDILDLLQDKEAR